mgnify:CR=1 FL=1
MIDKLALTTHEVLAPDYVAKQLRGLYSSVQETGSKYHLRVQSYRTTHENDDDAQLIAIHSAPRHSSISPTKIEVNPTRFGSFTALKNLIQRLVDPLGCTITRLDHAVDLPIQIEAIQATLIWPRKQDREVYKSRKLTGFYLGKPPEQLAVYDRARKLGTAGPLTRLELRQYRDRLPFRAFGDLPRLIEQRPFGKILWLNLDRDHECLGTRQTNSLKQLQGMVSHYGAHQAFKLMNEHSNFRRNFSAQLERPTTIPNPDELYARNIERFFAEVPNANRSPN